MDVKGFRANKATAITPADGTDIGPFRAFYVGGAGNAVVMLGDDTATVTLNGLVAGTVYPLAIKRVNSTLTTATGLVGLN